MPKRSAEEKLEYYRKKLKKLEKQADNRRENNRVLKTPDRFQYSDEDEYRAFMGDDYEASLTRSPPSLHRNCERGPSAEPSTEEDPPELAPDLLTALGDTLDDAPTYGPEIHPTLAERWMPLLRKGLSKDIKDNLIKQYTVPKNCPLLQAPKLNVEISAAIVDMARNRDKKMESSQQQLGIGITALNRGLTTLLTDDDNLTTAIKYLSDSCRILGDLHYMDTQARIKVITPGLAKSFLTVIQDNERDETLFGEKLSEKIKASKVIEKQGLQIKKPPPAAKPPSAGTSASTSRQYQGNWQGNSRYSSNRGGRGGGQRRGNAAPQANRSRGGGAPQNRAPAGQSKQQQRPAAAQ